MLSENIYIKYPTVIKVVILASTKITKINAVHEGTYPKQGEHRVRGKTCLKNID